MTSSVRTVRLVPVALFTKLNFCEIIMSKNSGCGSSGPSGPPIKRLRQSVLSFSRASTATVSNAVYESDANVTVNNQTTIADADSVDDDGAVQAVSVIVDDTVLDNGPVNAAVSCLKLNCSHFFSVSLLSLSIHHHSPGTISCSIIIIITKIST